MNRDKYIKQIELSRLLNVNYATITHKIKNGELADYIVKVNNVQCFRKIDLEDISEIIKPLELPNGYISVKECSVKYDLSTGRILQLLRMNRIKGAKKIKKGKQDIWLVPEKGVIEFRLSLGEVVDFDEEAHITVNEVAQMINVNPSTILRWAKKKVIKYKNVNYLLKEDLEIVKELVLNRSNIPDGYLSAQEIANLFSVDKKRVTEWIRKGKFDGAIKHSGNTVDAWIIPESSVNEILEKINDCLTIEGLSKKLGFKVESIRARINRGNYPNAFKYNNIYYIPNSDVEAYENLLLEQVNPRKKARRVTKRDVLNEVLDKIQSSKTSRHLLQTKMMYVDFVNTTINRSRGQLSTIASTASDLKKIYENIIMKLEMEIFHIKDEFIKNIVGNDNLSVKCKQLFLLFVKFAFSEKNIPLSSNYVVSRKEKKNGTQDIYPASIFKKYIEYVRDIEAHLTKAIKSKQYAQMWLYTSVHLINTWRAADIVKGLPTIQIELYGINSFDWIKTNRLSQALSQSIVNEVYMKLKNAEAQKNGALSTFIVPPDMVITIATSMVICELHRRNYNDTYLLETFITGRYSKVYPPNLKHRRFFGDNEDLAKFQSLKMNKTVATYLFHTITESGKDADLALALTQKSRAHKHEETTAIYVKTTNSDGTLDRVAINLFNRGHFGWIYNYLIMMIFDSESAADISLEQRTELIQHMRNIYSPAQLENWASFITKFKKKRQSIVINLSKLSKEELINLIRKIYKGEMPSKTEHGQCLTYPSCINPNLRSCFQCENFIPQLYILLSINSEFQRLINSISSNRHESIILRDSELIKTLLLLVNEALEVYDSDYVASFIDLDKINTLLIEHHDKLLL